MTEQAGVAARLIRPTPQRQADLWVVKVTPKIATDWLENANDMNRPMRITDIELYAELMNGAGEGWNDPGVPVFFDTDNQMIDGQHRMAAVVKAGIPIEFTVGYDRDPRTRLAVDDGRKRTFADDLAMNGQRNSSQVESLLRKIKVWKEVQGLHITGGSKRVSRAVLAVDFLTYAGEIRKAMEVADAHRRTPCSRPVAQFMAWLLLQYAPESLVHEFLSKITIGSQDAADRPLIRLRDKLLDYREDAKYGGGKSYTAVEVYFMIRGWNAWAGQETRYSFDLPQGGLRPPFRLPITVQESK